MTIALDSETAKELINFKLNSIQSTVDDILSEWNQNNVEDFLLKAKNGTLENAEMDAITVRQLIRDIDKLQSLLSSVK